MANFGFATLQLIPSFKGAQATVNRELAGVNASSAGQAVGKKFGGGFSTAAKAVVGLGAAKLLFDFGKSSISASVEAETAQNRLSDAYAKFPALAGGNIKVLQSLNSELARKTKFDDDATASGQAVLAQFGLTQDQLAKVTPLLQDYAAKTGKDLPTAAKVLGKAVLGQGRGLKEVGLNFKDTGTAAGNLEQLMGGLNDKVGGFATREGATAAGKAEILKNQFGELQERVGGALLPALSSLADVLITRVLPGVETVISWLADHQPVLIAFAAVVGVGLVAAFTAWAVSAAAAAAATLAAAAPVLLVVAAVGALTAGVIWAYKNWGWFKDAVDAVARFLTGTLWPALQSIWAFIRDRLIPIVIEIGKKWLGFYATVAEVAGKIIGKVIEIGTGIVNFVRDGKAKLDSFVSFFVGLPGRISSAARGMFDGLKSAFRSAINWIIDAWNGLEFKIPGFDPPGPGPKFGGFTLGTPTIPRLHSGGLFNAPPGQREGLALLLDGERVLSPGASNGDGGGRVFVAQLVLDRRVLGEAVYREFSDRASDDGPFLTAIGAA